MRILVVSSWFPWPPTNGSKLRGLNLLAQLAARRHQITLLSFAETGEEQAASALRSMCAHVETVPGNPHKAGTALARRRLFGSMPRSYASTYSHAMQRLIDRHLGQHDVALALQIGAAVYFRGPSAIPRIFEEAEVGVIRERYLHERHALRRARQALTCWKFARFMRFLTGRFDRTTVVSDVEHDHLAAMGCNTARIEVVPNGVDGTLLERPVPTERSATGLIYTGSIGYAPNLDAVEFFVTSMLPMIRRSHPDVSLQVTGDTQGASLEVLTASGAVTFTGHVPDVTPLLSNALVCVVPLRIGGGTRLKVLEALAAGTPVVSTSKGIEGLELTPERDVLVGDTPADFARQVSRLLSDASLRATLVANGRQLVGQRYTWNRIGDTLERVIVEGVEHFNAHAADRSVRRVS